MDISGINSSAMSGYQSVARASTGASAEAQVAAVNEQSSSVSISPEAQARFSAESNTQKGGEYSPNYSDAHGPRPK